MTEIALSRDQQSLAKRYGWEISRDNHGNYRVDDRFIAQFYIGEPGKNGVYTHKKLVVAIQAAFDFRREHDAEMTRRSGFGTGMPPKVMKVIKAAAGLSQTPPPPPVVTRQPRVMIDDSVLLDRTLYEVEVLSAPEFDDVELDNTNPGRAPKKLREPPRRSKKESVYLSAARVIVKRPNVNQEALAKDAKIAMASAKICRVAFRDIVTTLDEAGFLSPGGKRMLASLPVLKKGVSD